ncbi:MAG TPA: serine/threonine-protein kinase [Haliangiales bacterium]|nr:serine/threonine-protein kinase [Haliangiales bacterium]
MIGEIVGSYRIMDTLGAGGMGVVYLAEHQVIGRKVAIKVLLPELSHNHEVVNRFFNEARSSALIRHPGIVDIIDFGHHANGSAYIVMEHLVGETLGARLRRAGRIPEAGAAAIARQAAGALAAAHGQGIIHRDLKPDNIYLVPDADVMGGARVKILDFGIAKLNAGVPQSVAKTRTGAVMGSPLYMSPEQSRGAGHVDERSDVYSLGCVMFEMLAGRPPFVGEGVGEVIGMHIHVKPPRLRSLVRGVSPAFDGLIASTLAKQPEDRPASMGKLIQAIDKATRGRFATKALGGDVVASGAQPAPAGPLPSTLGRGTGEIVEPAADLRVPMRRRWPLALIGLALVGAVAAAIAIGSRPRAPAAAAPATPDASPPAPPATAPPSTSAPAPAPPPRVRIRSTPPGARVVRVGDGAVLGVTPCDVELPRGAEARLRLTLAGYRDQELRVKPDDDRDRSVTLDAVRREPTPAPQPPRKKGDPVDPFAQ